MKKSKNDVSQAVQKSMEKLCTQVNLEILKRQMETTNAFTDYQKKLSKDKVNDVKFIGKVNLGTINIEGKEVPFFKNAYVVEQTVYSDENGKEEAKDIEVFYLENDDGTFLKVGGKTPQVTNEIMLKDDLDIDTEILKAELNRLIEEKKEQVSLAQISNEIIEKLAKTTGIPREELAKKYNILELDLSKEENKTDKEEELNKEETDDIIKATGHKSRLILDHTVDTKKTIGETLGLPPRYTNLYIVYKDNESLKGKPKDNNINQVPYSFVAVDNNGNGKIVNDLFEIPESANINTRNTGLNVETNGEVKITEAEDNIAILGIKNKPNAYLKLSREDNGDGNVAVSYDEKLPGENRLDGISTSLQTRSIRTPDRIQQDLNDPANGIYRGEQQSKEAITHSKKEYEEGTVKAKDVDGNHTTSTHTHGKQEMTMESAVKELMSNDEISDKYTEREIRKRLMNRKPEESIEQAVKRLKNEMLQEKYLFGDKNRTRAI